MIDGGLRQVELVHGRPAQRLLGRLQFFFAQRVAVRREVVLLLRAAVADMRVDQNQRRLRGLRPGLFDRLGNFRGVVAVQDMSGVPAIGLESLRHVFGEVKSVPPASEMWF